MFFIDANCKWEKTLTCYLLFGESCWFLTNARYERNVIASPCSASITKPCRTKNWLCLPNRFRYIYIYLFLIEYLYFFGYFRWYTYEEKNVLNESPTTESNDRIKNGGTSDYKESCNFALKKSTTKVEKNRAIEKKRKSMLIRHLAIAFFFLFVTNEIIAFLYIEIVLLLLLICVNAKHAQYLNTKWVLIRIGNWWSF